MFTDTEPTRACVEIEGRKLSYLTAGPRSAGPTETMLLIHGAGVSARTWLYQLRGLRADLRLVAVDLPGHGDSDPVPAPSVEDYADVAHGLLEVLGIGPVFVAGHSLGGAVSQMLAGRHPDAVKGLVLISTCVKSPGSGSVTSNLLWVVPGPIRKILFFWSAKRILYAPGAPADAVVLGMQELRSCRPETILKDVAAARAMDLTEIARGLRVPTLVLCGSRDSLTPLSLSRQVIGLIQGVRLAIVEGAGHMLPLEAPEQVNEKILRFIKLVAQTEAGRAVPAGMRCKRWTLAALVEKARRLVAKHRS